MIEVAGTTDRGSTKPINEDRIVVGNTVVSGGSVLAQRLAPLCVAVFDGMSTGGHGVEAVGLACAELAANLDGPAPASTPDELGGLFGEINDVIRDYAQGALGGEGAATTVAGLLFCKDGTLSVFNAGDSRVYRLRDGAIEQLSHDHSILQRLKDEGALELLAGLAESGSHTLTRALGRDEDNPVEFRDCGPARDGDLYLVCTDGVTDGLTDEQLAGVLAGNREPLADRARGLVRRAVRESLSKDNATAVLVQVLADGFTGDAAGFTDTLVEVGGLIEEAMGEAGETGTAGVTGALSADPEETTVLPILDGLDVGSYDDSDSTGVLPVQG